MLKLVRGVLQSILFHKIFNCRLWLTYRCNYRCLMCAVSRALSTNQPEMSLPELKAAAANLKKLGVGQVVLTGGEPLLRADIVDIIDIFRQHGFIVRLQTNGGPHVTEDLLDRCYEAGLDDISVSLDTLDAHKQDVICRAEGVTENALRVLRYCRANYSDRGVVAANIVISRQNFFELPRLIQFCNDNGLFFNPCVYVRKFSKDSLLQGNESADDFMLTGLPQKEVDDVFKVIWSSMKKDYTLLASRRFFNELREYMRTGDYHWRCAGGLISCDIAPSGEFAPCCDTLDIAFRQPVANVKDKDFLQQYFSKGFQEKCRLRRQECPGCMYACYRDPKYLVYHIPTQLEMLRKSIAFRKALK